MIRFLELDQRLVRAQLDQELQAYLRARTREDSAAADVAEAAEALDRALQDDAPLDRVYALVSDLDAARGRARSAAREVEELVAQLVERRRRLAVLEEELRSRRAGPADLPDPITGTWRLTLEDAGPERDEGRTGLLDLELDGTAVTGTLGLGDGTFGSVRGTFVRGFIRLERVSADSGLDLILEGRYDPADGNLRGTWRPAVAGLGNPGGGTWSAVQSEAPAPGN
jgi:multidrug efflux pump subunit AcrA (membrane-fusion protein)